MTVQINPEAVAEIRSVLDDHVASGGGLEPTLARLRQTIEKYDLHWFPLMPKQEFNRKAALLLRTWSYGRHCADRDAQLLEGSFEYWLFKAGMDCPDEHQELDGLALPPESAFWSAYTPPLDWDCDCYVMGAGSAASARRLGGDPEKSPPDWTADIDPITHVRPGVGLLWANGQPDLIDLLDAIARDDMPADAY